MAEYTRSNYPFLSKGMQLTRPIDQLAEGKYAILRNVRSYQDGTLQTRPGLVARNTSAATGAVHSVRTLNDPTTGANTDIVGSGTALNWGTTSLTSIVTGLSGNPLSFVPHRPTNSPKPFMYVADSIAMRKVDVVGNVYNVGIASPLTPASYTRSAPLYTALSDFEAIGSWTNGGTAGALATTSRVNTTVAQIKYDTGSTGWANVSPTALDNNIQPGAVLNFGGSAESARVTDVYRATSSTTISSIKYDSGTTGPCTIVLTAPSALALTVDAMLRLAASENVRIEAVVTGPDGLPSIRVTTTGARSAGDAVAGLGSFRVYMANAHAAGDTITGTALRTSVTVGTGYMNLVSAVDLTTISSRPIQPDDEVHISLRVDTSANVTEGRIMLDVDSGTNDFSRNYYYYSFRANDLTPAVAGTITTLAAQQRIQQRSELDQQQVNRQRSIDLYLMQRDPSRDLSDMPDEQLLGQSFVDSPEAPPYQAATGDNQWTELRFKVSDLVRVGSDTSRSLKDVAALRVQVQVTATTQLDVDSWWIGGTYGLDTAGSVLPYNWVYRYRSSATGAKSNPSPPMRSGIVARREGVTLTPAISSDSQVDKIDYFRFGGTLTDYQYVGTTANSGTFLDTYSDLAIASNPLLERDNYQPWPLLDLPRTGTCDVKGTEITRVSGDLFSLSWARGSEILVNGIATSLYTSPSSTGQLSVEDNLGTQTGVTFFLPSPTKLAQPLRTLWGPFGGGSMGVFMFACKDEMLYWTKGNDPDSTSDMASLEITSPSEPLLGGCVYDGRAFVFSSERMFQILPNFQTEPQFIAQEVPIGKGLFSAWGLAVGEEIYFLAKDGIYATNGSQVTCITDEDLYPLFPHDGVAGVSVNGVLAPDFSQASELRLFYGDGVLKFKYRDTGGTRSTLSYDTRYKGWTLDTYTPQVYCHYWREGEGPHTEILGGSDGRVYVSTPVVSDAGTAIACQVRTRAQDLGDFRARKFWGDCATDVNPGNSTVNVVEGLDNYTTLLFGSTLTGVVRKVYTLDLTSGGSVYGSYGRNLALDYTWSATGASLGVVLYNYDLAAVTKPEASQARPTDWTDAGHTGAKFVNGFILEADTGGVNKVFQVQYDGGTVAQNFTINHAGQLEKPYALTTPIVASELRLAPTTTVGWELFRVQWLTEPYPENTTLTPDTSDLGWPGAKWIQGVEVEADTGGASVGLSLLGDDDALGTSLTLSHPVMGRKAYSFVPFIATSVRAVPLANLRLRDVKWIWEPEPDLVRVWTTQNTTHDLKDYQHLYRGYVTLASTVTVTLTVTVDGVAYTYSIPSTAGLRLKREIIFQSVKGRVFSYSLTSSSGFRLYKKDCEILVKPWQVTSQWATSNSYQSVNPFGAEHRADGARI